MSTGVPSSDHQRSKGQGNANQSYNKSSGNDHYGSGDHDGVDTSWRNQQNRHQGYGSATGSDSYNAPSYYGSFPYQNPNHSYPVNESSGGGGSWSNNGGGGGDMFSSGSGGYGGAGMHEAGSGEGHREGEGMFGGNNSGGFGNFGGQAGYGYGYGNGDYTAWGPQSRKHYNNDYYREGGYGDERGMKSIEQGMGGLQLDKGMREYKEMTRGGGGSQGKGAGLSWASVASQPAKPQSISKKSKTGIPLPPMMSGMWESKNGMAKAPIAAPVQAPAWERPKVPPPIQQPPAQPPPPPQQQAMPPPQNIPQSRGYQHPQHQPQHPPLGYGGPKGPAPPHMHSSSYSSHSQPSHNNGNLHSSAPSPPAPKYPDDAKMKEYNPGTFDLMAEGARFFVIKSYSEDDIHRSIKYEIWCSTEHGNKRLDEAFKERQAAKGIIYLFYSVNGSGHFCGMAQMVSALDYNAKSSVWSQDKWKGQFKVKWVYVKDVPNSALRHIRLENNENKPVTNSRDTQEVPFEKGKQVLKILHTFTHTTSIFDDFIHYEKRQEEEAERKVVVQPPPPPPMHVNNRPDRGGRGGFHDRGGGGGGGFREGHHHGPPGPHDPRGEHNMRDFRDRGEHRGGYGNFRNDRDYRDRPERDQYRDDGGMDRRDRDMRGGYRGGGGGMGGGQGRPPFRSYET